MKLHSIYNYTNLCKNLLKKEYFYRKNRIHLINIPIISFFHLEILTPRLKSKVFFFLIRNTCIIDCLYKNI